MQASSTAVRLQFAVDLSYEVAEPGADFVFNLHAAHTRHQTVCREQMEISQPVRTEVYADPATANRYLRLSAQAGVLALSYSAVVELHHHCALPEQVPEVPVPDLPAPVLSSIYPSRYCQSDSLGALAMAEFGLLPRGYSRVLAIQDWVRRRVRFQSATTTSATSALDTLAQGVGVCRDFAHVMIALCRALSIPARFTTGIDFGADPSIGPPDFHAYVEVYLGHRWYIFDPAGTAIPMGFVRLGTGRDASDVSFATIFGDVLTGPPLIRVEALQDPSGRWQLPQHTFWALSTDPGP
ncbi:MAG: transglutaminase family protein [Ideonella sp.]|nr:transglutaminase family protein [Ideonella sp.]